jgi:hypothetical protein
MYIKPKGYIVGEITSLMSPGSEVFLLHLMQYRLSFVCSSDDLPAQLIFVEQRHLIATYAVMLFCILSRVK